MNVLQWLKNVDANFAAESANRAANAQVAKERALADRLSERRDVISGIEDAAGVEGLAPEVLAAVLQERRRQGLPHPGKSTPVTDARSALVNALGGLDGLPTTGTTADKEAIQTLLSANGIGGGNLPEGATDPAYHQLVNAIAAYQAAKNPGMSAMVQGGLSSLNTALSKNPYARAGLYSGVSAGGIAGGVGLTQAGMDLLQMAGLLQEDAPEARPTTPAGRG